MLRDGLTFRDRDGHRRADAGRRRPAGRCDSRPPVSCARHVARPSPWSSISLTKRSKASRAIAVSLLSGRPREARIASSASCDRSMRYGGAWRARSRTTIKAASTSNGLALTSARASARGNCTAEMLVTEWPPKVLPSRIGVCLRSGDTGRLRLRGKALLCNSRFVIEAKQSDRNGLNRPIARPTWSGTPGGFTIKCR